MRIRATPARSVRRDPGPAVAAACLAALAACGGEPRASGPACGSPERVGELPAVLDESSGLAASRGRDVLWTHNDSGNDAVVYAIGAAGGLRQRVAVAGAVNRDWEDIALAPCDAGDCLYIADIGDNRERRDDIAIYRVPEPAAGDTATAPAERLPIRYPEGAQDAEALFVPPSGELFVVTKGRSAAPALYRYPPPLRPDETVVLARVQALGDEAPALPSQITGAAAAPDGAVIALRTYVDLRLHRLEDGRLAASAPMRVNLTPLAEPQGEAVELLADGTVVLTSEAGSGDSPGPVSRLACSL